MTLIENQLQISDTTQGHFCPQMYSCRHIEELKNQINELTEESSALSVKLAESEALAEKLKGALRRQLKDRFDKSTEKSKYLYPDKNEEPAENQAEKEELLAPGLLENEQPTPSKERKTTPHGRIIPQDIPVIEEIIEISEGECNCTQCGCAYRRTTMYEESSEIDIQINVVRKRIMRAKYAKVCDCEEVPEIITAEKPPNIIYKSLYSTSLWVLFLMFKYCYQIPIFRQTSKMWNQNGVEFKNSTIIGGFKKLYEVLVPLYNAMIEKSKTEKHWHADETSWKVFVDKQGKKTFNWWMWVFASANVVIYILDRTRSAAVPQKHLGDNAAGIINVDRYAAYKVLAPMLLLALCWYHVRRDFIKAAASFPCLGEWAQNWIDMIAELEAINEIRVDAFTNNSPTYAETQLLLESKVDIFFNRCQEQLDDPVSSDAQKKVLRSLLKNKAGLTVFVDNPLVPMHNNLAERMLRPHALARNNFYGSRAPWSGELAAICMSIYMTAQLHSIDPQAYMEYYFHVCAKNDSKPPDNLEPLLIWNLSDEIILEHNLRSNLKSAS